MISIDRFEEILSDLAEEIPQSFYEELNGGIVVEPGYLLPPGGPQRHTVCDGAVPH